MPSSAAKTTSLRCTFSVRPDGGLDQNLLGRFELRLREGAEPREGAALDDERRRVRDPLVVPPPDRRLVPAVGGREFRFVC